MNDQKKVFISLTFVLALGGVCLMTAAFATDYWIESFPRQLNTNVSSEVAKNDSYGSITKYTGNISFGLFKGHSSLDYGTGARPKDLRVMDMRTHSYFNFGLWVGTIVMLALGIVGGLVSMGFAVFNIFGKPIETLTGPMGLYLWNGLACTFSLLAVLLYTGLFVSGLKQNVLNDEDLQVGWTSENRTYLGFSFYLVVGTAVAFLFNILLLMGSGQQLPCSYSRSAEKEMGMDTFMY